MTLSHGAKILVEPLIDLVHGVELFKLSKAIKRVGRRGNGVYYPNDIKRLNIILECRHDTTGYLIEVQVANGNFQNAINKMKTLFNNEERLANSYTI